MSDYEFDTIVIGSGVSGGWAAKELTEKGMKVLMLDRGRMVEHSADYPYEGTGPWEQPYRGQTPPALLENDYYASRYGGAGQTAVKGFMNNDRLNPYAIKDGPEFRWVRPGIVGGKSVTWGRVSLRFGPQDFEANGKDGHGNDWPIR